MKIIVRQKSGLGNQLFQYAAGWYYAKRYGAKLRIAVDLERRAVSYGYPRPFLLSKFAITSPYSEMTLWDRRVMTENPRIMPAVSCLGRILGIQVIAEQRDQYHTFLRDIPLRKHLHVLYLIGYWQAFQIAEAIAEDLRKEFRFREPAKEKNLEMLQQIRQCESPVSLHIRRGDYTLLQEGNKALPMSYYLRGVSLFRDRFPRPVFFVFSDDIGYARANLPHDIEAVFVSHNDDFTAHEDLRLMSACRHHIIANSSFSWWGAWLNTRQDKIVYAPKLWYLRPDSYYPDLLPSNWVLDSVSNGSHNIVSCLTR